MIAQTINISVILYQQLQVLKMAFLCCNVGCRISLKIGDIKVVVAVYKHLNNIFAAFHASRNVQSIVPLWICIVDVDAVLGEHAHYVSMATASCNPKGIHALLILLINVNHRILKHQTHKFLAIREYSLKRRSYGS